MRKDAGDVPAGLGPRVISGRSEGVFGVIGCAAAMIFLLILRPQKSAGVAHPVLALAVFEGVFLLGLCLSATILLRPPRVELDAWGYRVFDPFFGRFERSWNDCGEFPYTLLKRGYVYLGPGFNTELPRLVSYPTMLPLVTLPYGGMRGKRFADLLNRYRDAYATNLVGEGASGGASTPVRRGEDPSAAGVRNPGREAGAAEVTDWLTLDPPPPDA